jgi:hypothetical protein
MVFVTETVDPQWQKDRWKRDRIAELPEGVSLVRSGKAAYFYVRNGNRVVDVYAELSGNPAYDVLVFKGGDRLTAVDVTDLVLTGLDEQETEEVLRQIRTWLDSRSMRYSVA